MRRVPKMEKKNFPNSHKISSKFHQSPVPVNFQSSIKKKKKEKRKKKRKEEKKKEGKNL